MRASQTVFFLVKSEPSPIKELADFILRFPGLQEVWATEGAYSFIARFQAPEGAIPLLASQLSKHKAILQLETINAPLLFIPRR